MPESATKILDYLCVPATRRSMDEATMMLAHSDATDAFIGARVDNSRSFVAFPKLLK